MSEYACTVKVASVESNTGGFGATATLEFIQPSVGIDFTPIDPARFNILDAAAIVKEGAILRLTISDEDPQPPQ
jgi:hypothetical protein